MSPRPRKHRGLEPNLYPHSSGQYRYRHPQTGKYHYMGRDKKKANDAAKKLNAMLMQAEPDLVEKVIDATVPFSRAVDAYLDTVRHGKKWSEKHKREVEWKLKKIRSELGHHDCDSLTVRDFSDCLDRITTGDRARQQYRVVMRNTCAVAVGKGWMSDNRAAVTLKPDVERQRIRLTIEGFEAVRQHSPAWLQNALDLALVSLQRESDVAGARFDDVRDRAWYCEQQKTGKRLAIDVRIQNHGMSLEQVVARCRDNVVSPFIIHRLPEKTRPKHMQAEAREHHTQVLPEQIMRAFAKARRDSGYYEQVPEGQTPPTFHEVRSLGADLYRQAGWSEEQVQALLGHADVDMTRAYLDGHERPWEPVGIGGKP